MVALPTLLAFVGRKITNRTNGMLEEVAKHTVKTEKDLPRRDTPCNDLLMCGSFVFYLNTMFCIILYILIVCIINIKHI